MEKAGHQYIVGPIGPAPHNQRFFVSLVDYHPKWPEVCSTAIVMSAVIIAWFKPVFAREGLPCEIVADNEVQFALNVFLGVSMGKWN